MEKIELTDLEKDLIELIGGRRGAARAIARADLCAALDYVGDRHIRATIKHLVVKHKVAIASGPRGYFTPVTPEEFLQAGAFYDAYGMASLQVKSALCGSPMLDAAGQGSMDFSREAAERGHGAE